jgi:hypothetical protein
VKQPRLVQFLENFGHAESLHYHFGDADNVGLGAKIKVDIIYILIDQSDFVFGGR